MDAAAVSAEAEAEGKGARETRLLNVVTHTGVAQFGEGEMRYGPEVTERQTLTLPSDATADETLDLLVQSPELRALSTLGNDDGVFTGSGSGTRLDELVPLGDPWLDTLHLFPGYTFNVVGGYDTDESTPQSFVKTSKGRTFIATTLMACPCWP